MQKRTTIRNILRARLIEKGTNIEEWGRDKGYGHGVVHRILCRYIGTPKRPKAPSKTFDIITGLEHYTGIKICG